jgi:hypothetical protein
MVPSKEQLEDAIYSATKEVFSALLNEHPEHYYYCTLITTGEAHSPIFSAWSLEAFEKVDPALKWSYADSPYCCYKEEVFNNVNSLFALRPQLTSEISEIDWLEEYSIRLDAMESAMKRLDKEGLFCNGMERNKIVINVEVMPPDHTNTERAKRLNPVSALSEWLDEAAE